jgi:hypothetical protein
VVASYFGVAGTLIGTAVVSVVSSIGAALYAGVIGVTAGRVQRTTVVHRVSTTVRQPPWMTGTRSEVQEPGAGEATGAAGGPDQAPPQGEGPGGIPVPGRVVPSRAGGAGGGTSGGTSGGDGEGPGGGRPGRPGGPREPDWRRRWLMIAGVAVVIFAIAIGALTGIEAAIREPLASALGVRHPGEASTSIGVAVHSASGGGTTSTVPPSSTTGPGTAPSTSSPGQAPSTTQQPGSTTTGPSSTTPPTTTTPRQPAQPQQRSAPTTSGGG